MGGLFSKNCPLGPTLNPVKTVHVDAQRGSDDNNGKCHKHAFKTLDRAIQKTRCYKSVKFVLAEGDYPVTKSFDSSNYWFDGQLQEVGKYQIVRVESGIGMNVYKIVCDNLPSNSAIAPCLLAPPATCTVVTSNIKSDNTFVWEGELDLRRQYTVYQQNTNIKIQAAYTNNRILFSNCFVEHNNDANSNNNIVACENVVLAHNSATVANGELYLNRSLLYASEFEYKSVKLSFDTFAVEGTLELSNGSYDAVYGLARELWAMNSTINKTYHITDANDRFTNCIVATNNIKFGFATYTCCNNNCHDGDFVGAGLLGSSDNCAAPSCRYSCGTGRKCKMSGTQSGPAANGDFSAKTTWKCKLDIVDTLLRESTQSCVTNNGKTLSSIINCDSSDTDLNNKKNNVCKDNLEQQELVRYTLTSKSSIHYFAESAKVDLRSESSKLMFIDHSTLHYEFGSQSWWAGGEGIYPIDMIGGLITGSTKIRVTGSQTDPRYFSAESGSLIRLDAASYVHIANGSKAINFLEDKSFYRIPEAKTTTQSVIANTQTYQNTVNTVATVEPSLIPTDNS